MQTDGQLYDVLHRGQDEFSPPSGPPAPRGMGKDELLILAVMFLILRGGEKADLPLLAALAYILLG